MKLKRKSTIILALLLAVVSVFAAVAPTFAANDTTSAALPDGLAIVAPVAAYPNQSVTMTVFQRSDQTPVAGAGVWAVTTDQAPQLKAALDQARQSDRQANTTTDWESFAAQYGTLLGRTDASGRLTTTFTDGGRYVLVAAKNGYLPGVTTIGIVVQALAIQAPQQADANTTITISVANRASGDPVADAGVYALTRDEAQSLQTDLQNMQDSGQTPNADTDWTSLLNGRGTFLGTTDSTGAITASFAENGGYLLLAVKTGYLPGRAPLLIGTRPQPLSLQVPGRVKVGDDATLSVTNRVTGTPVAGAGVWALGRSDAEAFRQELQSLKGSNDGSAGADLSAWLGSHGTILGTTDANGSLTTSFADPGPELLVAWKTGTLPGIGIVIVTGPNSDNGGPSGRPGANDNGASGNVTTPAGPTVSGSVR